MMIASALPITGSACWNQSMLTGPELGAALKAAMQLKGGMSQTALANEFGVRQPSVSEWIKFGRISKSHIPKLIEFFSDVAGPDHWGIPISKDEFDLILAYRSLSTGKQQTVYLAVKEAAKREIEQNESFKSALTYDDEDHHEGNASGANSAPQQPISRLLHA